MQNKELVSLGFDEATLSEAARFPQWQPARISEQHRDLYRVLTPDGEYPARLSGALAYELRERGDFPAVGDFVLIDPPLPPDDPGLPDALSIRLVLPRRSVFARKAAGRDQTRQVVAANADAVFLCMALGENYNLARLERFLTVAWDSGATPVVVLTKADLCPDVEERVAEAQLAAPGCDVVATSSVTTGGYDALLPHLACGQTAALLGSSGVGKSTMINGLAGKALLATKETRRDEKGRHTTTSRQLIRLDSGAMMIDTPGMRELQLDHGDVSKSFADIEALAKRCRFADCRHDREPGCAVRDAIEEGELSAERFESYQKLAAELAYVGLDSRSLEQEKIKRMFGGMGEMKQAMRYVKEKNKRR